MTGVPPVEPGEAEEAKPATAQAPSRLIGGLAGMMYGGWTGALLGAKWRSPKVDMVDHMQHDYTGKKKPYKQLKKIINVPSHEVHGEKVELEVQAPPQLPQPQTLPQRKCCAWIPFFFFPSSHLLPPKNVVKERSAAEGLVAALLG